MSPARLGVICYFNWLRLVLQANIQFLSSITGDAFGKTSRNRVEAKDAYKLFEI